jgi:hypothetical protein
MAPRIGVVLFPGTNCEYDAILAVERLGATAELVWHGATSAAGYDALILPGGFAHGDYLRPGAIARFSPVMDTVAAYAADGGPVIGICNGFQVLTEAGLLPGALQKNRGLRFLCTTTTLRVERDDTALPTGTPAATWSASCPTPSGPRIRCSAPRTAPCCSVPCCAPRMRRHPLPEQRVSVRTSLPRVCGGLHGSHRPVSW